MTLPPLLSKLVLKLSYHFDVSLAICPYIHILTSNLSSLEGLACLDIAYRSPRELLARDLGPLANTRQDPRQSPPTRLYIVATCLLFRL